MKNLQKKRAKFLHSPFSILHSPFSILLLFLLFQSNLLLSQNIECRTGGIPDLSLYNLASSRSDDAFTVKVHFNIVRDVVDGQPVGGYDPARLPILTSIIDGAYNPHKIYFDYDCDVTFIDNHDAAVIGHEQYCEWSDYVPSHINRLDIIISSGLVTYTGLRGTAFTIPSNRIAVFSVEPNGVESTSIIHEIGHAFGLQHMHVGSNCIPNNWVNYPGCPVECGGADAVGFDCATQEFIYDSNYCPETNDDPADPNSSRWTCGDLIPDTPPSHYDYEKRGTGNGCLPPIGLIKNYVEQYCEPVIGVSSLKFALNPDGEAYSPDMTNYMSILLIKECRDHFTPNQVTVMKNHLEDNFGVTTAGDPQTCLCSFDEVIVTRGNALWSNIVNQYNLNSSQISDREIIVEGDLTIDQNYSFLGCEFRIEGGKKIYIPEQSTVVIDKNSDQKRSSLTSCYSSWEGLTVEGILRMRNTDVRKAEIAVNSKGVNTMTLYNNSFNSCEIGLQYNDRLKLDIFRGNIFNNGHIAVNGSNAPNMVNLAGTSQEKNIFKRYNTAINLINTAANIRYANIDRVSEGINLLRSNGTWIENCEIGSENIGVDLSLCSVVTIQNNDIGYTEQRGAIGIDFFRSTECWANNNNIGANRFGIKAINSNGLKVEQCTTEVVSTGFSNAAGMSLGFTRNMNISDNWIYTTSAPKAIDMIGIRNSEISHNYILAQPTFFSIPVAINVAASTGNFISYNDVYASSFGLHDIGIQTLNAPNNQIDCNDTNTKTGIRISTNSSNQLIRGNDMTGIIDLEVRSVVGHHYLEGNRFNGGTTRTLGLDPIQVNLSIFTVNDTDESQNYLPENITPFPDWFDDIMTGNPQTCSGTVGPMLPPVITPGFICSFLSTIPSEADWTDYYVELLHFVAYYQAHPTEEMPACLVNEIPNLPNGVVEVLEVITGVSSITENSIAEEQVLNNVREEVKDNLDNNQGENLDNTLSWLSNKNQEKSMVLNAAIQEAENLIHAVDCTEEFAIVWKNGALAYLDYLSDDVIVDETVIINLSQLCADLYGDPIHWARVIASDVNQIYYDDLDESDCSAGDGVFRKIEGENNENPLVLNVAPNPSKGNSLLSISDPSVVDQVQLINVHGATVANWSRGDISETMYITTKEPGLHLIKIQLLDGSELTKKLLIIN